MTFVSVDVETANANLASICSIGVATFENTRLVSEWHSLIDPKGSFDLINVSIHGIDEETVHDAPSYREIGDTINQLLCDEVVVSHTHFDRLAISQAAQRWNVEPPVCIWLDSARVARRTWKDCARSGYGLRDLCRRIGYEFEPHDALQDAKAAAQVVLAAMNETGLDLYGILHLSAQSITPRQRRADTFRRNGNPDGPLFGEVVVFTGRLDWPRREAADIAANAGCIVTPNVTKTTTLLVVGDYDNGLLRGHEKSSKHRKAERLISKGQYIRIIGETDFHELAALHT